MQELSDLWRATAPDAINISGDFSPRKFTAALHHLKPGKVPGPDSHLSGPFNPCCLWLEVLATWLPFFLLAPTKNFMSLENGAGSRDP